MRPLGVGEVLDTAINLYFRNLRTLLAVAAVVAVPLFALVFLLDTIALREVSALDPEAASYEFGDAVLVLDESTFVLVAIAQGAIAALGYLLVIGACFGAVSDLYTDRETSAGQSARLAARRLPTLLLFSLLWAGGVLLGFLMLVVPGIILIVAWSVAIPALMVERLSAVRSLGRSFHLTEDNWWRILGALVVGFVFIGLFQLLIGLGAQGLGSIAEDSPLAFAALLDAADGLTTIVTAPLQAAIATVIYYDLRVRKEGYDVQLLAEGLGGEVQPGTAPWSQRAPGPAPPPGWVPVPAPSQPPPPSAPPPPASPPPAREA